MCAPEPCDSTRGCGHGKQQEHQQVTRSTNLRRRTTDGTAAHARPTRDPVRCEDRWSANCNAECAVEPQARGWYIIETQKTHKHTITRRQSTRTRAHNNTRTHKQARTHRQTVHRVVKLLGHVQAVVLAAGDTGRICTGRGAKRRGNTTGCTKQRKHRRHTLPRARAGSMRQRNRATAATAATAAVVVTYGSRRCPGGTRSS